MGNWAITIEGGGIHHNGPSEQKDADKMAKAFVRALLASGHSIREARFTQRGGTDESAIPSDLVSDLIPSGYGEGYKRLKPPEPTSSG